MRFREKFLIFIVAALVSFLGFSLIASSSICVLKVGKEAGYEIIENYLTRSNTCSQHSCLIEGLRFQNKKFNEQNGQCLGITQTREEIDFGKKKKV